MIYLTLSLLISSETIATIVVADVNDNSPQFLDEPYVTQLSEVRCTNIANSHFCLFPLLAFYAGLQWFSGSLRISGTGNRR